MVLVGFGFALGCLRLVGWLVEPVACLVALPRFAMFCWFGLFWFVNLGFALLSSFDWFGFLWRGGPVLLVCLFFSFICFSKMTEQNAKLKQIS